jgi:hypothetical protein
MKFFEKKTGENDSGTPEMQNMGPENKAGKFSSRRIVIVVISAIVLLWLLSTIIGFLVPSTPKQLATDELISDIPEEELPDQKAYSVTGRREVPEASRMISPQGPKEVVPSSPDIPAPLSQQESVADSQDRTSEETREVVPHTLEPSPQTRQDGSDSDFQSQSQDITPRETKESITQTLDPDQPPMSESSPPVTLPVPKTSKDATGTETAAPPVPVVPPPMAPGDRRPGIATTEAIINVLEYELRGRWWGWRPNDLIQITDNVQNYQLGVLEVSRRAVVALAERMSRTGSTALYDQNLEMAMNWIMVKAESYWFPSAESKYKETVKDMRVYVERLERGTAHFYTRTDNLIPLLASFEDLLGSCDEILLKMKEDDGRKVSTFKVDDYFYYSKGVIDSMLTILQAVREDFYKTLDGRRSVEIIDHAIYSLKKGKEVKPWVVLNSNLSSVLANHRSNLAGPVSHARFHLGLMIRALST